MTEREVLAGMVVESHKALLQAEEAIKQLSYVAGMISGQQYAKNEALARIAAKRKLNMRLTKKESAMWTLYGD